MALNVEFEGYVNEIKTFDWGNVVKMTHQRRAKNALSGEWETIAKDYIDVTPSEGVELPEINTVARVKGTLRVDLYDKTDGSKGLGMKVRAQEITKVDRNKSAEDETPW